MWAARRSAGGHVIRLPEVAVQTDHARSVQNHPATALDHARHHRARAGEHAFQVDADHDIELFVAHHAGQRAVLVLDELTIAQDAGVVDQDVYRAEPGRHLFHRALDRGGAGDIHLLENAAALLRFAVLYVPGGDAAAFQGEAARGGETDTSGAAGHDDYLIFQSRFDHLCLPPNVAHREAVGERVFRVHHVLREARDPRLPGERRHRSEEHTSELQSLRHLVC